MFRKILKMLFGKESFYEETRGVEDTCNYWADENEVDYSPSYTAQDILSSSQQQPDEANNNTSEEKQHTSISSCGGGCGGGCLGGCGCGGCL